MHSQETQDRLRKAAELRHAGVNPYPSRFESTHSVEAALALGKKKPRTVEALLKNGPKKQVTIRGRIMTIREHGRLAFANLKDASGTMQICFMEQVLGKTKYKLLRQIDMGDFLGCSGELFLTKHGQLTVLIKTFTFLGKALRPLPEKWHGVTDQETIYRQRYLDLIMNDESMDRFKKRSRCLTLIRQFLNEHEFTELEFPLLEPKASGATARPFHTHHNALDMDVYLRIACELPQKMAIVGGFERTYEIARVFRNEGMDPSHLQEFTMLEWYAAYWNYEDNMNFTEKMIRFLIKGIMGTLKLQVKARDGKLVNIDFAKKWPRLDFGKLIQKDCGVNIYDYTDDAAALRAALKKKKIQFDDMDSMGYGNLCDYLYKKVSRPHLVQPCFVINHPASMKPLARRSDKHPEYCETFQLLINTWEVVNAYSEIVDSVDQKERFIQQAVAQAGGDQDAMELDVRFITAMEHGMPPISGNGIGIDRFMTLITGQDNLRDLVLFPLMRLTAEELEEEAELRQGKAKPKDKTLPLRDVSKFTEEPLTKLLYWDKLDLLEFDSIVSDVVENEASTTVILNETAFYPQGGGQPYDQGFIKTRSATFKVEEVRFINLKVHHIGHFETGKFKVGEEVAGLIDAERRLYLARIHSAGHIVDYSIRQLKLGWKPGKGYHFPEGPYDEYEGSLEGLDKEKLKAELEKKCNDVLKKFPPVDIKFMTKDEMHKVCDNVPEHLTEKKKGRVLMYDDYGMACGGTPIRDSQKIGHITIRKIKMEGGKIRVGYEVERD